MWLNRDDPPPVLPSPWCWHETHSVSTEALLGGEEEEEEEEGGGGGKKEEEDKEGGKVNGEEEGGGKKEEEEGEKRKRRIDGEWGNEVFVVMGAGCSVQDFRHLKEAWANAYPFDKELLQVGRWVGGLCGWVGGWVGGWVSSR